MGRTCYCCDKKDSGPCDLCPVLLEPSSIKKSTISIKGFQDYNFDQTYSDDFISTSRLSYKENMFLLGSSDQSTYPGSMFKGQASIKYTVDIKGLNNLNTEMQFDLVGNKFIPKQSSKFLGEVTVTTISEHSISGKGYAFFPLNYGSYHCSEPCTPTEPCSLDNLPWPPIENCFWYIRNEFVSDMREADIPSDWNGKIGVVYKYDFYLVSEAYSCDLGKNKDREPPHYLPERNICETDSSCFINHTCSVHLGHMIFQNGNIDARVTPAVRFVAVLKETEIIEDGIYKQIGYVPEGLPQNFNTCYQTRNGRYDPADCPVVGQSPCSGLISKRRLISPCRNPLNTIGIGSEVHQRAFFPNNCTGGRCYYDILQFCSCEGLGPPSLNCPPSGQAFKAWVICNTFQNHYNFFPVYRGPMHEELMPDFSSFINSSCDLSVLTNLIKDYRFVGKMDLVDEYLYNHTIANPLCYPNYDDPCLFCNSYDDAEKKIKQKYRIAISTGNFGFSQNNIIEFQNNTNYSKIFNPCDKIELGCDLSNTTGVGIFRLPRRNPLEGIFFRDINFLDFIFDKYMPSGSNLPDALGFKSREPDANSNCWNYNLFFPAPFDGMWGAAELEFTKKKDILGTTWNPNFKIIYWPTPSDKYCNKTFFNHPNLNWTATGKNNNNEIIDAIILKKVDPINQFAVFTLPRPPETIMEVEYE